MYHIGTIVLKQTPAGYEIIDGQQRLVTLALYTALKTQASTPTEKLRNFQLGQNNSTKSAKYYLLQAKQVIVEWPTDRKLDLARLRMSVIVIDGQSEENADLPFLFFNHLNSSGKRLSDYELLKSHHLRYVGADVAQVMAERWNKLDSPADPGQIRRLLHRCLYRLRKWLEHDTSFPRQADETATKELFRHFSLDFEPVRELCTPYQPTQLNSMLSGGLEFFNYVECYRQKMEQFLKLDCVSKLAPLADHSYGTLYNGILALAFMFFCKYGDIYLADAVTLIALYISAIRNEAQVRQDFIARQTEFINVASWIDRSTQEGEFLGKALSGLEDYQIKSCSGRPTATYYWTALQGILRGIPCGIELCRECRGKILVRMENVLAAAGVKLNPA